MEWFKMYPSKYLESENVHEMSHSEEVAYFRLILKLYDKGGKVEENLTKLCRTFRIKTTKRCSKVWENIKFLFQVSDGMISHPQVTIQLQRIESERLRKSEGGRRGGLKGQGMPKDTLSNKELRTKNTEDRTKEEDFSLPVYEFHDETERVVDAWLEAAGLTTAHCQEHKRQQIDAAVRVHGADRVEKALTAKRVVHPGFVLSSLDKGSADGYDGKYDKNGNATSPDPKPICDYEGCKYPATYHQKNGVRRCGAHLPSLMGV